jgi:magnesium transporter
MKELFEIKDGVLVRSTEENAKVVIYTQPSDKERQCLLEDLHMTRHDLESALDPDELSRVEFTPEHTYVIWKRPDNVSYEQQLKFEVSSAGIFLRRDRLTIIFGEDDIPFGMSEFRKITDLNDVLLKFFWYTIHHYFGHLKAIKLLTTDLQSKLNVSFENRYLLQMFALSESLIYYMNAVEANAAVLTKLRSNSDKIGFTKEALEMLDDVMIEHQQCSRQTQIYSTVLSGLMDARGSIINNNMNVLLRNLMIINVVFLPLTLIASIGGMSEYSMMTASVHWALSYSLFLVAMVVIGWVTWRVLVRRNSAGARVVSNKK